MIINLVSPFLLLLPAFAFLQAAPTDSTGLVIQLLTEAKKRGHMVPALSPADAMLQGVQPEIDVKAVRSAGFPVVVWTVNDPNRMRVLLEQKVDGIISDRPDLLQQAVRAAGSEIDVQGHRGGRDLRPENTLPSFENGLDNLITTIETDTGVTKDHVSLISHEQFINPQTCRAADGSAYTAANQVWIKDIEMAEAAGRFICDKVFRGPQQQNDLALSPVAAAFARTKKMVSPYSPTNVAQLFEFTSFYASYYRSGSGKTNAQAAERAANAKKVRFNLETKITPEAEKLGHTFNPETFTQTLAGIVIANKMQARSDIQSFDFRTLALVEKNFPGIRTVYLMESLAALNK